jgi:hypothetical protein
MAMPIRIEYERSYPDDKHVTIRMTLPTFTEGARYQEQTLTGLAARRRIMIWTCATVSAAAEGCGFADLARAVEMFCAEWLKADEAVERGREAQS